MFTLQTRRTWVTFRQDTQRLRVISGFRRDVDETSVLQGCYAACSGKSLPTFRANYWSYLQGNIDLSGQLSVLSSRKTLPTFWDNYRYYLQESLKMGPPIICL